MLQQKEYSFLKTNIIISLHVFVVRYMYLKKLNSLISNAAFRIKYKWIQKRIYDTSIFVNSISFIVFLSSIYEDVNAAMGTNECKKNNLRSSINLLINKVRS